MAVGLALAGSIVGGCAPAGDLGGRARGDASGQARVILSAVEGTVADDATATDEELPDLLRTNVDAVSDGWFELDSAQGRTTTWNVVVMGAADGPGKSQTRAAACFQVVVDRDADPVVSAADQACPADVVRSLEQVSSEDNIVSVTDVRRD